MVYCERQKPTLVINKKRPFGRFKAMLYCEANKTKGLARNRIFYPLPCRLRTSGTKDR